MPLEAPTTALPRPGHTDEVLYERRGTLGRILLNRPRAINSLTTPMVDSALEQLQDWAEDDEVVSVSIEGVGPKGLCAGGDMRAAREATLQGRDDAIVFWDHEYRLDAAIAAYPKPYVAFMDGIVMGGGVGVSAHGSLRLATERTRLAMPETAIGFFPDVAGCWWLAKAPGEIGPYLAMSGTSITGADAVATGFADALISSDEIPSLLDRLAAGERLDPTVGDTAPASPLMAQRDWIDPCFAGDDAAIILARLERHDGDEARECAAVIRTKSPLSVAVALEAVRRASRMRSVREVLQQDRVLGRHFWERSDMPEGVRVVLVDKGKGAPPQWLWDHVEDVPHDVVQSMFVR
ncbi:3-hydroxyisobutyryl-CoA hydrolase [Arsenicicoccus sp. oral taxon 190]|uniref:3-hydroxyisobutyryl-CoA hydrolase n=1 Tax=Arsenicicoccus sp. oral taxon 190 TaxID=1658671 RepID=UPI000679F314|nr:3-hydroxyisobutyryl-CoA hydrolase [Arsenicicoccus sp. oral taxon 190]AKT51465.1 3-hydroxyisobutyryl-CoA hydrolase [Arsenicicoccus sp. oral taxon 190]